MTSPESERLAYVAEILDTDPDLAQLTVRIVLSAWPHLTNLRRAELINMVLTEEVRAVIAAQVIVSNANAPDD